MTLTNQPPQVVTIAGSDSGGGAGIQADLKTFQARKVFGTNIIVALTAQNTLGVQESYPIDPAFVAAQFDSLAADFSIKAAKTGMLADKEHVECVVAQLKNVDFGPLVVDPVMIAKGGHPLLKEEAIDSIRSQLLPLTTIVTPNIPEAEVLVKRTIATEQEMITAAKMIQELGVPNVIVKGGHHAGRQARDYVLFANGKHLWLSGPRIATKNTHGTGDTFSACLTAELAKGVKMNEAIILAKRFIQGAISQGIQVGHGHGPTNHWAALSDEISVSNM